MPYGYVKGERLDDVDQVIAAIRANKRLFHGEQLLTAPRLMGWSLEDLIKATAFGRFRMAIVDEEN